MTKAYRQGQILRIVRKTKIYTQDELAQELAAVGVAATQVTLSRDMRELGLVKTPDGYRPVEAPGSGPALPSMASEFLIDVRLAQNLVVLKTSAGHASSLAAALDQEDWAEVVGTIAGDDTVLVIVPDAATAQGVEQRLRAYMEF